MIRGLYISSTGMLNQMALMDTITNNLANINTSGYKKDINVSESFPDIMYMKAGYQDYDNLINNDSRKEIGSINLGVWSAGTYMDMSQGSLQNTNNKLDFAIEGSGYFAVDQNGVEVYTRDGHFSKNPGGALVTSDGNEVEGTNGPIILPDGDVTVKDNGDIYVGNRYIDTLKIVSLSQSGLNSITRIGDNLIKGTPTGGAVGKVAQGYVETSNVNPVSEMVDMIQVTRTYEANQKMITSMDETLDKAVNDVGRI